MQFRENSTVYTADGREVGTIDRVVLDPSTNEVTHIVVRQGWLFTEDKVVPTELVTEATADQVRLRVNEANLEDLPRFEETYYQPYDDAYSVDMQGRARSTGDLAGYARPYYMYPPIGIGAPGYGVGPYDYPAGSYTAGAYPVRTERNIPEGTVALKEGASVVDDRGNQVGRVARLFMDNETQRATHLLIAEGWLFTERRLVPIHWVSDIADEEVQLNVSAEFLKRLPEYRGEPVVSS